jgi:hypothetical protein
MDKVAKAVLRYLFQMYQREPAVLYTINEVTSLYEADPIVLSDYMLQQKWIREQWIYENNSVGCRITIEGIEVIEPLFIHNKLKKLVGALVDGEGRKSLMQLFQHNIKEYLIALDLVHEMEKRGLVTILHVEGNIEVQLTADGWRYSENDGRHLFALMSVA